MLFFAGGERREEAGEGEKVRGVWESFFSAPFLWLSRRSFFSESNASQKTMPVIVLLLCRVFSSWQITTKILLGNQVRNLEAKFELGSHYARTYQAKKLGSQVQTWQNFAKFEFGCQVRIWYLARTWQTTRIKYQTSVISLLVEHGDLRLLNNSTTR